MICCKMTAPVGKKPTKSWYHTLKIFDNEKLSQEYNGPRTPLSKWMFREDETSRNYERKSVLVPQKSI